MSYWSLLSKMLSTNSVDISQSRCGVTTEKLSLNLNQSCWENTSVEYLFLACLTNQSSTTCTFLLHRNQPLRCFSSKLSRSPSSSNMSQLFFNQLCQSLPAQFQSDSHKMLSDSHKMWSGPRDQWAETVAGSEEKSLGV